MRTVSQKLERLANHFPFAVDCTIRPGMTNCFFCSIQCGQLQNARFLPQTTRHRIFDEPVTACCMLLLTPTCCFSNQGSCLRSSHLQLNQPVDVVHVVLQEAPISAIDALQQNQRLIVVQHVIHFLNVLGFLEIKASVVIDRRQCFQTILACPTANFANSCKSLQNVHTPFPI